MLDRLHHLGGRVSDRIAHVAGYSATQILVALFVVGWLLSGRSLEIVADILGIGAFALTQMILNQQRRREKALHLKLDELILAIGGTRDELAGVEARSEAEIAELASRD